MIFQMNWARTAAARLSLFGALGGASAFASCASETPPAAPPGGADVAPPAAEASLDGGGDERHGPAVVFSPCAEAPGFECGTLAVPADYDDPKGETLGLAVTRAPATGARLGTLFVNFGGPGGFQVDALQFLAGLSLAPLRERFDLVAFDPRGTPSSEPATSCHFEPPAAPAPGDAAARAAYLDEHARRFAEACLARTGPAVTKLGTNNVARDVDRLRAALGEKTLSYYGISYGAELGAVYASLFPKRVRAMLLDGGLPDAYADFTLEAYAEQAAATELALARVDRLCQNDPACPLRDVGLAAGVGQVLATLRANPAPAPGGAGTFGEREAALAVYVLLFNDRNRWGQLPGVVAAALEGDYGPLSGFFYPVDLSSDAYLQPYAAVLCNDFGSRRPAAAFLPALEAIEALYPVGKAAEFEVLLRSCQAWPAADPPVLRDVARKLKTPVLFVGNDFDPVTPMNWTRRLAKALGLESSVVRYEGGGHTATFSRQPVPCVDEIARRYLVDLELPPEGAACPALPVAFAPKPARTEAAGAPSAARDR